VAGAVVVVVAVAGAVVVAVAGAVVVAVAGAVALAGDVAAAGAVVAGAVVAVVAVAGAVAGADGRRCRSDTGGADPGVAAVVGGPVSWRRRITFGSGSVGFSRTWPGAVTPGALASAADPRPVLRRRGLRPRARSTSLPVGPFFGQPVYRHGSTFFDELMGEPPRMPGILP
jgi:hypothetical protein